MTEQTIEQLRAELAQAQTECNVLAKTFTDANELHAIVRGELAQTHVKVARLGPALADARRIARLWFRKATERERELAQARAELKDLQVANRVCEKRLEHQTHTHNFWFETCRAAEAERDQIRKEAQAQSDDVQARWLSPCEAEGLRRQLKHAEGERDYWVEAHDELEMKLDNAATGEAAIVEAAEAYLAQRKHRHLVMDEDCKNLQDVLGHRSEAAAKLLERLATLDDVEQRHQATIDELEQRLTRMRKRLAQAELAAHVLRESNFVLAQNVRTERAERREAEQHAAEWKGAWEHCSRIRDENGKTIMQMEQRAERAEAALATERQLRREAEQKRDWWCGEAQDGEERHTQTRVKLAQAEKELLGAELAAHIHDKAAGEPAQTVHTDRARRRVAEREREAMSEMARDRGSRLRIAEQRAEQAEAELDNGHAVLTAAGVSRSRELGSKRLLAGRAMELKQQAEALAALVTPELANLLDSLGSAASPWGHQDKAEDAHNFATDIREALEANDEKAR